MERSVRSGENATKSFLKHRRSVINRDTKWKEYEFKAKPGDPTGDRRSLRHTNCGSTGNWFAAWLRPTNIRGHYILFETSA